MLKYTVTDPERRYRYINASLMLLILAVLTYTLCVPIIPRTYAWTSRYTGQQDHLQRIIDTPRAISKEVQAATDAKLARQPNNIIIPAMLVDEHISELAPSHQPPDRGVWRWPTGSTPDKGGNTVLLGNRFSYHNPRGTFYFITKLRPGSTLSVTWQGKTYRYAVVSIVQLQTNDTSVLAPSRSPTLTLYSGPLYWWSSTCTAVTAHLKATT